MNKTINKARVIAGKVRRLFRTYGGAVMNFHNVGKSDLYVQHLGVTLSAEAFEQRIAYLTSRYKVVPFSQFCQNRMDRTLAAVTFDDGYSSFLTDALPILEKYKCPVKMFLNSDQVEGKLGWLNKLSAILSLSTPEQLKQFAAQAISRSQTDHPERLCFYRHEFEYPRTLQAIEENFAALAQTPSHAGLYLGPAEIKKLLAHPLLEWGSHTTGHLPLEKLPPSARSEAILEGHRRLLPLMGDRLSGFALPFGGVQVRTAKIARIVSGIDTFLVTATGERCFQRTVGPLKELQRLRGDEEFERLKTQLK